MRPLVGGWNHGNTAVHNGITCWSVQGLFRPDAFAVQVWTTMRVCLKAMRQQADTAQHSTSLCRSIYFGRPSVFWITSIQCSPSLALSIPQIALPSLTNCRFRLHLSLLRVWCCASLHRFRVSFSVSMSGPCLTQYAPLSTFAFAFSEGFDSGFSCSRSSL